MNRWLKIALTAAGLALAALPGRVSAYPLYFKPGTVKGSKPGSGGHQTWIQVYSSQYGAGRGTSSPTGGATSRHNPGLSLRIARLKQLHTLMGWQQQRLNALAGMLQRSQAQLTQDQAQGKPAATLAIDQNRINACQRQIGMISQRLGREAQQAKALQR